MTASIPGKATLHSIHGLRFFAAFAVVLHHALTAYSPSLTNVMVGAAGVDVFFVISGVVIGYVSHEDGVRSFLTKRVLRVIPLYWVATLVSGLIRYWFMGEVPTPQIIARSLFLIPDFATDWHPIYYPAWSLCFEMAFYLLFAALIPWRGRAATLTAAMMTAALAVMPVPVPFVPGAAFNTPLCLEFAIGLLIAETLRHGFRVPPAIGVISLCLGLCAFALRPDLSAGHREVTWGVPAALVVFGVLGLERLSFWRGWLLTLGGSASYAIYLFHISAMDLLTTNQHIAGFDPPHGVVSYVLTRATILPIGAVAAGVIVHLVIEQPMLNALRRVLALRKMPCTGGETRATNPVAVGTNSVWVDRPA